jgi:hypothetical protein
MGVVVVIILAEVPVIGSSLDGARRLGEVRLLLPLAVTVGLVAKRAAGVAVNPHGTVRAGVEGRAWGSSTHTTPLQQSSCAGGGHGRSRGISGFVVHTAFHHCGRKFLSLLLAIPVGAQHHPLNREA